MRLAAAAILCLLALAACDRGKSRNEAAPRAPASNAEAQAPIGFAHENGFDAQGYYLPNGQVTLGSLRLHHIAVGAPSDFDAWEGGQREGVFGPVVIEFEDTSSPVEDAAMGRRHTVQRRVLPLAYRLTPGGFTFHGKDEVLGEVDFVGAFDTAALAGAKATGASEGKPVLTGEITVGKQRFTNLALSYWAGD